MFSMFAWAFLLCALFFMFYHYFITPLFQVTYSPFKGSTSAVVVLHGSRAYGFPVSFKLTVEDSRELEGTLRLISDAQRKKAIAAGQNAVVGSGAEVHLSNLYTVGVLYDVLCATSSSIMTVTDSLFYVWESVLTSGWGIFFIVFILIIIVVSV
jgi:hypothetical protein